jgi:hypothetical protein
VPACAGLFWPFLARFGPSLFVLDFGLFVCPFLDFVFLYLYPGVGVGGCALCSVLLLLLKYYLLDPSMLLDQNDPDHIFILSPL